MNKIDIMRIGNGKLPEKKTKGAVCYDCYARLEEPVVLSSNERKVVPLGFALALPDSIEAQIRPRSGLSKKGIDVTLGTIDTDYRGEVMACVINNSGVPLQISDGDRICQLALRYVPLCEFSECESLDSTERGDKGFGSTGV